MTDRGGMAGKRVLVAEDDYFIAKGLVRDLRAAGAEVVGPAATVADALDLVRAGPLDGAVLDINLQGEMAFVVADALTSCGVPFIFASGYSADVIPERHRGIVRCEKPVDPDVLSGALFGTTDRRALSVETAVAGPQPRRDEAPRRR